MTSNGSQYKAQTQHNIIYSHNNKLLYTVCNNGNEDNKQRVQAKSRVLTCYLSLGTSYPLYGRSNPLYGRSNPLYGRSNPPYGRSNPLYGRSNPPYGRSNPLYGRSHPQYNGDADIFGNCSQHILWTNRSMWHVHCNVLVYWSSKCQSLLLFVWQPGPVYRVLSVLYISTSSPWLVPYLQTGAAQQHSPGVSW